VNAMNRSSTATRSATLYSDQGLGFDMQQVGPNSGTHAFLGMQPVEPHAFLGDWPVRLQGWTRATLHCIGTGWPVACWH